MSQTHITTTEAAKLAGVSSALIRRWCTDKLIDHFLIPGGGNHRRVSVASLYKYLADNGWPAEMLNAIGEQRSDA
jgi:hypothetical protein